MDYTFIDPPTSKEKRLLRMFSPVNRLFSKIGWNLEINKVPNLAKDQITVEQRLNLFLLANDVLSHDIAGDFIELGAYTGNSAVQIQSILLKAESAKSFHVYDKFNLSDDPARNFKQKFIDNFNKENLNLPCIHEGLFRETIPDQLPEKLAFVHIDCTIGRDQDALQKIFLFCLEHVYPRMSPRGICLIMDYHDVNKTLAGSNAHPGVKKTCDLFFQDKPEKMNVLYGNQFSHGYFRKK